MVVFGEIVLIVVILRVVTCCAAASLCTRDVPQSMSPESNNFYDTFGNRCDDAGNKGKKGSRAKLFTGLLSA